MMGEEFTVKGAPAINYELTGTASFAKVTLIRDNIEFPIQIVQSKVVNVTGINPTPEPGKTNDYYLSGKQKTANSSGSLRCGSRASDEYHLASE